MKKSSVIWIPHRDPYERAVAAFSAFYMSDAKWYKTFQAIANAQLGITHATWKFIDREQLFNYGALGLPDLLPSRLADSCFQPSEYKWIEWIHFPTRWRAHLDVGHEIS
jgi:hypothetical protein